MKIIDFKATDGIELDGILYESKNKTKEIIISVHGMSSNCFKNREKVIAKTVNNNNIDYFCFNNRGSELVKYIKKKEDNKIIKKLGGTTYEDVLEGYNDIIGAILKVKELGYETIYLQGHSLGATKVIYTYNKLKVEQNQEILKNIKSIILLSLIDIPTILKIYLGNKYQEYINIAEEKQKQKKELEIMPSENCIHPISVKTFLRYTKNNKDIDFINIQKDSKLEIINNIKIPIFMRWGNKKEMIIEEASKYTQKIKKIIKNPQVDISYINDAKHGYNGKEQELANQIMKFIKKIK